MTRLWSLLTLDDSERHFQGNKGYADELTRAYQWDQTVPNHKKVAEGDFVLLRNHEHVLGVAKISSIERWDADKLRLRCPNCSSTGFKKRATLVPKFRCPKCRTTFEEPIRETLLGISFYRAHYGESFSPLRRPILVVAIRHAYLSNASQHAIRELDLRAVQHVLQREESVPTSFSWGQPPG